MSVLILSCSLAGRSAADAEPLPNRAVAVDVLLGQVLQQPAAAADQQQQPTAAVVVVLVHLQVLGQVIDPPGQQRDLDFRRTGVTLTGRVLRQDLFLGGGIERHVTPYGLARNGLIPRMGGSGARRPHEGAANLTLTRLVAGQRFTVPRTACSSARLPAAPHVSEATLSASVPGASMSTMCAPISRPPCAAKYTMIPATVTTAITSRV